MPNLKVYLTGNTDDFEQKLTHAQQMLRGWSGDVRRAAIAGPTLGQRMQQSFKGFNNEITFSRDMFNSVFSAQEIGSRLAAVGNSIGAMTAKIGGLNKETGVFVGFMTQSAVFSATGNPFAALSVASGALVANISAVVDAVTDLQGAMQKVGTEAKTGKFGLFLEATKEAYGGGPTAISVAAAERPKAGESQYANELAAREAKRRAEQQKEAERIAELDRRRFAELMRLRLSDDAFAKWQVEQEAQRAKAAGESLDFVHEWRQERLAKIEENAAAEAERKKRAEYEKTLAKREAMLREWKRLTLDATDYEIWLAKRELEQFKGTEEEKRRMRQLTNEKVRQAEEKRTARGPSRISTLERYSTDLTRIGGNVKGDPGFIKQYMPQQAATDKKQLEEQKRIAEATKRTAAATEKIANNSETMRFF